MPSHVVPAAVFRNESIDRSCRGQPSPVQSCGFVLKPARQGGYRNRTLALAMVAVYVLRGAGVFTDWHGRHRRVSAGDMILMPPGRPHGVQQDPDGQWAEAYVTFDGAFGQQLLRLGVLDESVNVIHLGLDNSLVQRFTHILEDLRHLPDYALPSVLVQVLDLLTVASQLHRRGLVPDCQQRLVESACVLLSQGLDQRIDVRAVAAKLGMSYERFRKLFRQRVGASPGDYRIHRRIDRARAMIGQHRVSNKRVAYELGYPDPFTFSKQFHKVTGQWPEEYRRSLG